MSNLPDDVLGEIASYVCLVTFRTVCRQWNRVSLCRLANVYTLNCEATALSVHKAANIIVTPKDVAFVQLFHRVRIRCPYYRKHRKALMRVFECIASTAAHLIVNIHAERESQQWPFSRFPYLPHVQKVSIIYVTRGPQPFIATKLRALCPNVSIVEEMWRSAESQNNTSSILEVKR